MRRVTSPNSWVSLATGYLDATNPILMLAILFGLSMDYEVFLLSRIREQWDLTDDNDLAVATGVQKTGRIITSAALLLAVVIGAFALSGIVFMKMIGIGMLVALLIDATVVRAMLVPATMKLLGRWNWWAPGPLAALVGAARLPRGRARLLPWNPRPGARAGLTRASPCGCGEGSVGLHADRPWSRSGHHVDVSSRLAVAPPRCRWRLAVAAVLRRRSRPPRRSRRAVTTASTATSPSSSGKEIAADRQGGHARPGRRWRTPAS